MEKKRINLIATVLSIGVSTMFIYYLYLGIKVHKKKLEEYKTESNE